MGFKLCPVCKETKDSTYFTSKASACRVCASERSKQHYAKVKADPLLKEKYRDRINNKNKLRKQQAIKYLGGCCTDCNGVFPESVYDFHHVDMTSKEGNPSSFLKGGWDKAKQELDKCVLLCSNCHRIRHFEGEVT